MYKRASCATNNRLIENNLQDSCSVCEALLSYYILMSKEMHRAFLIRWQAEGDRTRWRSTVENVYTGEKHHFADRDQLLRFLSESLFDEEASASIAADHRSSS
jgi:hypothetical protein